MGFKKLTEEGKNFIRTICSGSGNSLISGKNRYTLPLSDVEGVVTTFTSNAVDHLGDTITSNSQLGEALIYWFDFYSKEYDIDANIIAAQAFQESRFKIWNYNNNSSASGISQFIGIAIYDVIIKNGGVQPEFTSQEVEKITVGTSEPNLLSSYRYRLNKSTTKESVIRAKSNRETLHQNIIDNPDLMIKAQCRFMRFISNRNNNIASNALFAYNRGSGLVGNNYTDIISKTSRRFGNEYIKEGVNYVEKIFGYLGDKNNTKVALSSSVKGIWFGYDIDFEFDDFVADLA